MSWRTVPVANAGVAKVDAEDFPAVAARNWYAAGRRKAYAASYVPTPVVLHRFILGDLPKGVVVDHINGDPLDNRRCNLRVCSQAENARNRKNGKNNRTGFKGVCNRNGRWQARLIFEGKEIYLGFFNTAEEAALAYDAAAVEYFGEFARLNLPRAPSMKAAATNSRAA